MANYFVAVAVLFGVFLSVYSQAPKPCCAPHVFSTSLVWVAVSQIVGIQATLTLSPADQGQEPELVSEHGEYYFDRANKRVAVNLTMSVGSQQPLHTYVIMDYGKKMSYSILDNKICQKAPLSGEFPKYECIPDNATFMGTVKLGDSYPVNRWLIDQPPIRMEFTTTVDQCVPVTSVMTIAEEGGLMTSLEYFNFKQSIDDPQEKFTPPSICNTVSLSTNRVRRSSAALNHFIMH